MFVDIILAPILSSYIYIKNFSIYEFQGYFNLLQNFTYILFNALGKIPSDAIAIGTGAEAKKNKAVAIGHNAKATQENQIVLGTADSTVYIPGMLVVGKDVLLNSQEGTVVLRTFE